MDKPTSNVYSSRKAFLEEYEMERPLDVTAEKSTTRMDGDTNKCYKMGSSPKGYALVVNCQYRTDVADCRAVVTEQVSLPSLWESLGYHVITRINPTARELMEDIQEFRDMEVHEDLDSAVMFLLAYGVETCPGYYDIYAQDGGVVNTAWIQEQFSPDNCLSLADKPKLMFFKICSAPDSLEKTPRDDTQPTKGRRYCNMLLTSSFCPPNICNRMRGTFVKEFCETFKTKAHEEDLDSMLRLVGRTVQRMYVDGEMPLTLTTASTLNRKVYFNPGLSD